MAEMINGLLLTSKVNTYITKVSMLYDYAMTKESCGLTFLRRHR